MIYNIEDKISLMTSPKHGCTQVNKIVSEIYGLFQSHNHSYENNACCPHGNIHNCMTRYESYNEKLPFYFMTRKIEEKILSYYLSNYPYTFSNKEYEEKYKNNSFEEFVDNLEYFMIKDRHHLGLIAHKFEKLNIDIESIKFLELNNLNKELNHLFVKYDLSFNLKERNIINDSNKFLKNGDEYMENDYFNINCDDISNYNLIDKSKFFNDEIVSKIKYIYSCDLIYML